MMPRRITKAAPPRPPKPNTAFEKRWDELNRSHKDGSNGISHAEDLFRGFAAPFEDAAYAGAVGCLAVHRALIDTIKEIVGQHEEEITTLVARIAVLEAQHRS